MISVIVPAYNVETYIARCLKSIVAQKYTDFEVIIVDDGSVDQTGKICDQWAYAYSNIKVFHKKNGGSASARNFGLEKAQGEVIAFVDADDFISDCYLLILNQLMCENNADIVECDFINKKTGVGICQDDFDDYEQIIKYKELTNIEALEEFCNKRTYLKTAVLWNKLYKRELFNGEIFPIGKGIDDEYVIYRVLYKANKVIVTEKKLYAYFYNEASQMHSMQGLKGLDSIEAIEKQLLFLKI